MPDRLVRDFPLFPLGIVALPHEYVPLHIFEPRYRRMIGECLERESEFGIVWQSEDGTHERGCAWCSGSSARPRSASISSNAPRHVRDRTGRFASVSASVRIPRQHMSEF